MAPAAPRDPLRLAPDDVALHQASTFAPGPLTMIEALERSPLFVVGPLARSARAEWVRPAADDEACLFPLGRVTVHPAGVLLEAFGESRLDALRRRVDELSSFRVSPDEVRVLPPERLVTEPEAVIQPALVDGAPPLDARGAAALWLRMAWTFVARDDLDGHAPHRALRTGRGRRALAALLPGLSDELLASIPGFPRFGVDALRELLLPEPGAHRPAAPTPSGERTAAGDS